MATTGARENPGLFVSKSSGGFSSPGSVNDTEAQAPLGSILTVYETLNFDPGQHSRTYRYVQLHSGATAAKGALVIWQDFFSCIVTTAATTAINTVAGFLQSASITAGNFCYILIKGPGVVLVENAPTAAAAAQTKITATITQTGRANSVAATTAPITGPFGVYLSAVNAVVNGSAALGTDVAAAYVNVPQPADY